MAQLEVRLAELLVFDAGEDGDDRNAEWELDFSASAGGERNQFESFDVDNVRDFHLQPINESFIFQDFDPERDAVSLASDGVEVDGGAFDILPANAVRLTSFGESLLVPGETLLVETFATGDNPDTDTGRSPIKGAFSYMVTWQLALREDATGEANITPASGAGGDLDTLALIGVDEPTVGSDLAFA